jgi:hypothetical protein
MNPIRARNGHDGFGALSGPSRRDFCRRALRPSETFPLFGPRLLDSSERAPYSIIGPIGRARAAARANGRMGYTLRARGGRQR